jgi:GGDEF domain-containing protein
MVTLPFQLPFFRKSPDRTWIVQKAVREVEAGRRLAIYDRETGLFAYWYLLLRFEEERKRAERYGHHLSVMLVELRGDADFVDRDGVTAWLQHRMRSCDLATHLGDGRYLVLMPETDAEAAATGAGRLSAQFKDAVAIGLTAFPADGTELLELETVACERLSLQHAVRKVA